MYGLHGAIIEHYGAKPGSVAEQDREKVDRVLAVDADGCPVARSLKGSSEITTALA